jgi:hypothetical protein
LSVPERLTCLIMKSLFRRRRGSRIPEEVWAKFDSRGAIGPINGAGNWIRRARKLFLFIIPTLCRRARSGDGACVGFCDLTLEAVSATSFGRATVLSNRRFRGRARWSDQDRQQT